jgi:FG-GAP-like repeat
MAISTRFDLPKIISLLACLVFLVAVSVSAAAQTSPAFYFRSFVGKCLDHGTEPTVSAVFLSDCKGTATERIVVQEIPITHSVVLRAGTKCIGTVANAVLRNIPLQVQDCGGIPKKGPIWGWEPIAQVFRWDGDSIIPAADGSLVVQPLNGFAANGTQLVLGNRDLSDTEFWTASAVDRTARKLITSLILVPQEKDLPSALKGAGWGTIVQIDPNASIDLTNQPTLFIPGGVTIRGGRHRTALGPELTLLRNEHDHRTGTMFTITGDNVRITGLRLRGPSGRLDASAPLVDGIKVSSDQFATIIDHNELSNWTNAAIEVIGAHQILTTDPKQKICSLPGANPPNRQYKVRVARNFIHDNVRAEIGYGVVASQGAYLFIDRNTFLFNRHGIAADGTVPSGYDAWFNLVLSRSPTYDGKIGHEFDMHGSNPQTGSSVDGGVAGSELKVARNTFFSTDRPNFDVRGIPCAEQEFRDNISVHGRPDAVLWYCDDLIGDPSCALGSDSIPVWLTIDSTFGTPNPTLKLGVGDFDGDGKDDLLLATGNAWYYSSMGITEWRFLNDMTDRAVNLMFGDFDGDGRTDVFTQHGRDWLVSWGGISNWQKINESDAPMSDLAIGDFDGDHRADVFYANGKEWLVSYGGVGPFKLFDTSSFRISDLRFGDFNGDGKTDVFGVANGAWSVTYGGTVNWAKLRSRLTDSVASLIVADFDGDGQADIIRQRTDQPPGWEISHNGIGNWAPLWPASLQVTSIEAVGRFDNAAGTDALHWRGKLLDIFSAGSIAARQQSRQDLR